MTDTKHTPTPWVATSNESYWVIVPEARGENDPYEIGDVCSSYPSSKDQGLQQANAAHIVKCVNLHDELVEALRECNEALKLHADQYPHMVKGYTHDAFINSNEALKKAGAL